jgi:uncharacterized OB-fold protein
MSGPRRKVSIKCECGQTVSPGSVFCPHCKAEIDRKNARVMKSEEGRYQKNIRGKGKKK